MSSSSGSVIRTILAVMAGMATVKGLRAMAGMVVAMAVATAEDTVAMDLGTGKGPPLLLRVQLLPLERPAMARAVLRPSRTTLRSGRNTFNKTRSMLLTTTLSSNSSKHLLRLAHQMTHLHRHPVDRQQEAVTMQSVSNTLTIIGH